MTDKTLDTAIASGKTYGDFDAMHAMYTRLRSEAPVRWMEPDGFRPFWSVSKHADLVEIERQPALFLNEPRSRLVSIEFETKVRELMAGKPYLVQSMHMMDGDKHKAYRNITAHWFNPRTLKMLEERISALAKAAVDDLASKGGSLDFYNDIAVWYPLKVIMLILGAPEEDAPRLQRITKAYFGGDDPEQQQGSDVIAATAAFREYFAGLTEERRKQPREDVASLIANAVIDGEPISEYLASSYYIALAGAGHDTTSASVAGGILAFIQNPDQWQKLQNDPASIGPAIDEIIRWVSPIKHFFRTATTEYELRGQKIRPGDALMMCYPSANRDEDMFPDPFSFRIDRSPNRHVGFGFGMHMCLGQMLAKFEMQIFMKELLSRVDRFELNGAPAWVETSFVGGLKRLPVRVFMK